MNVEKIKKAIRDQYGKAALRVKAGSAACCGAHSALGLKNPITDDLYTLGETKGLPPDALLASLGCGNPTAMADLRPGETVLDLGSGGGIDVLLSAQRVAPTGRAYGLDMSDEMLALARENQRKTPVQNVEFLKGDMENVPLPDGSVDVIISNCVINLSTDKDRVFAEAFRILRPGGRLAISDIVLRGRMPGLIRRSLELWAGCLAGALEESDYRGKLERAGFTQIEIEPTRVHRIPGFTGKFISAFVRATRPWIAGPGNNRQRSAR